MKKKKKVKGIEKQRVQDLIQRAEKRVKYLRRGIDNPDNPPRSSGTGSPPPAPSPENGQSKPKSAAGSAARTNDKVPTGEPGTVSPEPDQASDFPADSPLENTFFSAGVSLGAESIEVVQLVDTSLINVLGWNSKQYRMILDSVETLLTETDED